MQLLNLPEYEFAIREGKDALLIFDPFRSKYVVLTPEEQVRQHFARFLVEDFGYPRGLMMTEHAMTVNKMKKRCDIIVFHRNGQPLVLVECKAPKVPVDQSVFDQVARYNVAFRVRYLMVTNGMKHYCCKVDFSTESIAFLDHIPHYSEVSAAAEENTHR
jgi:hypothetical protein